MKPLLWKMFWIKEIKTVLEFNKYLRWFWWSEWLVLKKKQY